VADAVIGADPAEHDRTRAGPEPRCEHLPVVREDLLRDAVLVQGSGQRLAHWPGGGPQHRFGADDEPGMAVDPGDDLHFLPTGQEHPAHDVHLPQLHRPPPFPAAVILPPPLTLPGLHQPVADQRPVDA
jgi:hypothetical protein